jgi:hypothetical protein
MRFAITYLPANPGFPAPNFPEKKFNSRLVARMRLFNGMFDTEIDRHVVG